MKAKKISPLNPTPPPPPPTREQIQALAHAIWIDRGYPQGCDMEIWLEAERQLTGQPGLVTRPDEDVDLDRSDAARIDRELERVVSPPEPRSPTSL